MTSKKMTPEKTSVPALGGDPQHRPGAGAQLGHPGWEPMRLRRLGC